MKTTTLKQIGMIMLLAVTISFTTNAQNNTKKLQPFYHDCMGAKTLKQTQIISKPDESGKYLELHRKYNFIYDEQNRVTQKAAFKWNSHRKEWIPDHILSYIYENDQVEISLAPWSKRRNSYLPAKEKMVYTATNEGITSYVCYKRNNGSKDWEIVTKLSDLTPSRLIAGK